MEWLAIALRPLATLLVLSALGWAVSRPIRRYMKDGKLKRLLLTDVSGDANARRWREFRASQKAVKRSATTGSQHASLIRAGENRGTRSHAANGKHGE